MNEVHFKKLGLKEIFKKEALEYPELYIARVSRQSHKLYNVICENGELQAKISGKLAYDIQNKSDYPVVGDWVMIDRIDKESGEAIIHKILKRKTKLQRGIGNNNNEVQVIASNIDTIFICMALNNDFNLRRLERYLSIAWNSLAKPVIVLTKSDLCNNINKKINEVQAIAEDVDIITTSSLEYESYKDIYKYIKEGETIAFIGSSGVRKIYLSQ